MILIAFVERTFHKISRSNFEVYAEKSNRPIGSIDLENLLVSYWFSRGWETTDLIGRNLGGSVAGIESFQNWISILQL